MTEECIRCGLCCLDCLCGHGEYIDISSDTSTQQLVCKELEVHMDFTTTCLLIHRGEGKDLLTGGCVLRHSDYDHYKAKFHDLKIELAIKCD